MLAQISTDKSNEKTDNFFFISISNQVFSVISHVSKSFEKLMPWSDNEVMRCCKVTMPKGLGLRPLLCG